MAYTQNGPSPTDVALIDRLLKHLQLSPDGRWSPEEIARGIPISARSLRRWMDEGPTKLTKPMYRKINKVLGIPLRQILNDAGIQHLPTIDDERPFRPTLDEASDDER